jgi:hypothetical protein
VTWFGWFLLGLWSWSALVTVGRVGKPRTAVTPAEAALTVAFVAGLILGALTVGSGSL